MHFISERNHIVFFRSEKYKFLQHFIQIFTIQVFGNCFNFVQNLVI